MYTVYALYSPSHQKIYIGYTSNLEQRLLSHNSLGKKGWTIKYRPWELVNTEDFETKKEVLHKDKHLKPAKRREFLCETEFEKKRDHSLYKH
ncbi:GIY-YIG nuclease family protein [Gracilimonas amylolytica]|uniref:GIY-YIG nuclease family protein n=1 Tax=Gracilimonas amylolytica TaxID=1749045 RepID=UPI000CD92A1C|nr:GIY-YIG nuclease family protein [Gracilimonas amylolytica]